MIPILFLLTTRRFLPLFLTQFLGAFNDNVFKNALVMLITYRLASDADQAQLLVTLAAGLFILPFFLFSALAGQLADKYDRAKIARLVKLAEIALMLVAAIGFHTGSSSFLLCVLFCMGMHSTFFGPVKYALLPQHLRDDELISGNGWIEAGTFLAILTGTIFGGLVVMQVGGIYLISAAAVIFALAGYAASRAIPQAPPPTPQLPINWNLPQATWDIIRNDRRNRRVFISILAISWFWLIGATFLSQFPAYARKAIGGDETVVTLFLTVFSIGIGIGSLLCSRLLKGRISSRFVPWAAAGISLFTLDLYMASSGMQPHVSQLIGVSQFFDSAAHWRVLFDLLGISVCGGLYVVPLYAIMQHESDPAARARTIATNNVLNALFMVVAAITTMAMLAAGFSVPQVFMSLAVGNALVTAYMFRYKRKNP